LAQQQEALILDGRCRDPFPVWRVLNSDRQVLLLGYEIFPFVRERRLGFHVLEEPLADLNHAHAYILRDALARRILSPIAESYLRGYQYAADKQPRGGNRKSAYRIRGRGKTAEALAEAFGVSAATIERDAQITLAVHALMASCGADIKRLLLAAGCRLGKGDVIALAALPPEQQRERMEELRHQGHLSRSWRTDGEPMSMSVPLEPTAMAETIVRLCGLEAAQRVAEEILQLVRDCVRGQGLPRGDASSAGTGSNQNGRAEQQVGAGVCTDGRGNGQGGAVKSGKRHTQPDST
jgi:hypothetical protein